MLRRILLSALIISAIAVLPTSAAAGPYFEFSPDYLQSLLPAVRGVPSVVFLPQNDYLSGFDIWLSNGNTSSDATFTLFGPNHQQISSRTVTIPAIADTDSGTRYHYNLPAQIAVVGNAPYELRITDTAPDFRLYYAPQITLLPLNGVAPPAYTGGLARLDGVDQPFSFAFALYETREATPPVISNVTASQDTIGQVWLTFNATEPVDYRIRYNAALLDWTGALKTCLSGVQNCSITLPVSPATEYDYTLTVRDSWGNESSYTGSFTSLGQGQTPAPTPTPTLSATPTPTAVPSASPTPLSPLTISNARAVDVQAKSASFAWTTNHAANSLAVVQLESILITVSGNSDSTMELEHYINVPFLIPDTYYTVTITSVDSDGQKATARIQMLTPRNTPLPSPTPSSSPIPTSSVSPAPTSTATPGLTATPAIGDITWSAPAGGEPGGGYRIDVFDSSNNLISTTRVPTGTHSTHLDLPVGDNRVVIYADNDGVYQKVSAPVTVRVNKKSLLERILGLTPYILGGLIAAIAITVAILFFMKKRKPSAPVTVFPPTS